MVELKGKSEEIIRVAGGLVNEALPALSDQRPLRSQEAIAGRMLALYAMLYLQYIIPEPVVTWLEKNDLMIFVSPEERRILAAEYLEGQDESRVYWSNECVWAFSWMLGLIPDLPFDWRADDKIPEGFPNVSNEESPAELRQKLHLRPRDELMAKLDLYYRLGWWTRDCLGRMQLCEVNYDATMERFKALDWAFSIEDWDDVDVRNR